MARPRGRYGPYAQRLDVIQANVRQSLEVAAWCAGHLVLNERTRKGLTQDELAAQIGVDQIQISLLERGKRHALTNAQVDRLFRELGITTRDGQRDFLKFWRDHAEHDIYVGGVPAFTLGRSGESYGAASSARTGSRPPPRPSSTDSTRLAVRQRFPSCPLARQASPLRLSDHVSVALALRSGERGEEVKNMASAKAKDQWKRLQAATERKLTFGDLEVQGHALLAQDGSTLLALSCTSAGIRPRGVRPARRARANRARFGQQSGMGSDRRGTRGDGPGAAGRVATLPGAPSGCGDRRAAGADWRPLMDATTTRGNMK